VLSRLCEKSCTFSLFAEDDDECCTMLDGSNQRDD